jgi:DNA-binding NarL/FixJ family response regulator
MARESPNGRGAKDLALSLPAATAGLELSLDRLAAALQAAGGELRRARAEYQSAMEAVRRAEHEWAASAFGGLTTQERRVALLAIAGSTDAEIATATHLSVHTVKTHMKSVLRKLGLHSRWQIGQLLVDTSTNGFDGSVSTFPPPSDVHASREATG